MELLRALGALAEAPSEELLPIAESLELGELPPVHEHTELFRMQLVPYASVYLGPSGRIGGEARERIAGFWRVLGVDPVAEVDHLTTMLSSYAELGPPADSTGPTALPEAGSEALRHQRLVFLHEHLLSWLPVYLLKLSQRAPLFYRRWARLLLSALKRETDAHGEPPVECVHFRHSEVFPPPDSGPDDALDALLSPIRSGFVLTLRDLARAARELDIGCRIGERRFMLEAMLGQRPGEIRDWLRDYCEACSSAYAAEEGSLFAALEPWMKRAEITRQRLG